MSASTNAHGDSAADTGAEDDARINEEYKIWKKNAPFLYDLVVSHALEWPSLTLEWLPDKEALPDKEYSVQRLVLGTHTTSAEINHLMLAKVKLPLDSTNVDGRKYDEQRGEIGGFGSVPEKIEVVQRIVHDGEVNRARHLPAKPNVIATQTVAGAVTIFDYTKHASQPDPQQRSAKPDLVCLGHTAEGFSLAWSPLKSGKLLAGAEDKLICLWDVEAAPRAARELAALQTFSGHTAGVQDVGFHPHNEHVFGSCDDNGLLLLWDQRQANPLSQRVTAHRAAVNSLAFNPYCEFVLATASADSNVALWDLRNLHTPVHVLVGHQADVMRVEWAPFCERVLASGGNDRRVHLWDCSRIGAEQTAEDAEDGVPELLFVHGGHTGKINDLNWNPNEAWVLGSTSEDNVVQVWAMAESIYDDDANIAEDN